MFRRSKIIFTRALIIIYVVLSNVSILSCYSMPKFKGKGDLCGVVVDEKNIPIKDFSIYCHDFGAIREQTYTNESGIFVFHDIPSGKYRISGKKNGYSKIPESEYEFFQRGKIFCAQVQEINVVLDEVEKMISLGEFEQSKSILRTVYCERKTNEEKVVKYYSKFINSKIKEQKNKEKNANEINAKL